ncbi:hypothetical protein JXA88_02515 [Candidatus Fermentibacteria bacterium]|nr:hypothetical protein [Candidatus Fermentibacteria bacterium]
MHLRHLGALMLALLLPWTVAATPLTLAMAPSSERGLASNSLSTLVWDGARLWAASGSGVSHSLGVPTTALDWVTFTTDDGLPSNIIPALAAQDGIVIVSAASYDDPDLSYTLDRGDGLFRSDDLGATWDSLGLNRAVGIGNICWDVALAGNAVWAACWNGKATSDFPSGLALSTDGGATWAYPDVADTIGPLCFALAAADSTCWVGTGQGIGRTTDFGATWRSFSYASTDGDISGDWIVALEVHPDDPQAVWAATRAIPSMDGQPGYGTDGACFSLDGGGAWHRIEELVGASVWDFAFSGDTVWAATEEGLGFSPDRGATWSLLTRDAGLPEEVFYSVAVVGSHVYAGSDDGLVWSNDRGVTWQVMLASQPQGTLDTPEVYAYPNPFSPRRGQTARIRYSLGNSSRVWLRIFDFNEHVVRTLTDGQQRTLGDLLFESWDGLDDQGRLVPNGTYFFRLHAERGAPSYGTIMVLD